MSPVITRNFILHYLFTFTFIQHLFNLLSLLFSTVWLFLSFFLHIFFIGFCFYFPSRLVIFCFIFRCFGSHSFVLDFTHAHCQSPAWLSASCAERRRRMKLCWALVFFIKIVKPDVKPTSSRDLCGTRKFSTFS